eukprot:CAMPEP_0181208438 /NCGR_PEP_ID=MMETSP1096-20121128/22117_1 /TAXON_ID=156174 ORGANISM="Chrysochromulina ericina, Strain CCMP281" /NCGR_SAMPLE_ID=MMETSP1096 /ASSEMBLY_ACC=CAM_ASM_000453 /LENGTH=60 /DNA_ID=CAMNT_0023299501 /DNA_START=601 /DNA_END=780 /DNA_ORIENTATION=+
MAARRGASIQAKAGNWPPSLGCLLKASTQVQGRAVAVAPAAGGPAAERRGGAAILLLAIA